MIRVYNVNTGKYEQPKQKPTHRKAIEERIEKLEEQVQLLLSQQTKIAIQEY